MNTKIIIAATVAALSLATTAFAGEGNGEPFPSHVQGITASDQYAAIGPAQPRSGLWQATLPEDGQNGAVESPNSLPSGAMTGTAPYIHAQAVNQWFAQQADHRFAQTRFTRPNG